MLLLLVWLAACFMHRGRLSWLLCTGAGVFVTLLQSLC